MNKKLPIIIFYLFLTTIFSPITNAASIEVITYEYTAIVQSDNKGLIQKILSEAARDQGLEIEYTILPRKRAIKMFEETDAQLFLGEQRYFSNMLSETLGLKLMFLKVVLVFMKDNFFNFDLTKLKEMKGKSIGLSIGSNLTNWFENQGLQVNESLSLEKNIIKLKLGRIDLWGTVETTAIDLIRKMYPNEESRFEILEMEKFSADLVIKNNIQGEKTLKIIQLGLNHIIKNGKYKKILEGFYGDGKVPASAMVKASF